LATAPTQQKCVKSFLSNPKKNCFKILPTLQKIKKQRNERRPAGNKGFAKERVKCKLQHLCFLSAKTIFYLLFFVI
jgi:hypothetical protein